MVVPREIYKAALESNTAAIQEWFSTGTRDPDERSKSGHALLYIATINSHCDVVRVVLAAGANANTTNRKGWSCLTMAATKGRADIVRLLLDHGADVDVSDASGITPLIAACYTGRYDVLRLLLHRGADFAARDRNGVSAEIAARIEAKPKEIALLVDVRHAGGYAKYVRYPRFRLLMLRILAEQGRAETEDDLLVRLFPAGPPPPAGVKRPRDAYRAQKGGRLPRGIFNLIFEYWRSGRDYDPDHREPEELPDWGGDS